jgi:hypothetical protein
MAKNILQTAMELSEQVEAAKAESVRLDAEVKRMHNEIYGPLCAEKRDAKANYERLAGELAILIKANSELFSAIKKLG